MAVAGSFSPRRGFARSNASTPRPLGPITDACGILDRPVKPGDDSGECGAPSSIAFFRFDFQTANSETVIARSEATKQSILPLRGEMDCFAEPVIGRAFARRLAMTVSGTVGWAKRSVPTIPTTFTHKVVGTAQERLCPPYELRQRRLHRST